MNISLRQIEYICLVRNCGSVLAASRALNISPSSILAAIKLAEDMVGGKIFNGRRSRGMELTELGKIFVKQGSALVETARAFHRDMSLLRQQESPTVRIGCPEFFDGDCIIEALSSLGSGSRNVGISVLVGAPEQLHKWLVEGEVHVAITYGRQSLSGGNSRELIRASPQALVPRRDPIAALPEITLDQLAEHPLVLLDVPWLSTYTLNLFDGLPKRPQVAFRSGSYFTVCRAVAAGFGIAIVNDLPGPSGSTLEPGCVRIPIKGNLPQFVLHVADNFGAQKPDYIRHLVDALIGYFHRAEGSAQQKLCVA